MKETTRWSNNLIKPALIALGSAFALVLALFVIGVFGTKPANIETIQGEYSVFMNNDVEMLHLSIDENNHAEVRYRGIQMTGNIVRSMTTQEVATYDLDVLESTIGEPSSLTFSLGIPPTGFRTIPTGTWCIRFRNNNAEDKNTQSLTEYLLGLSIPKTQLATFEDASIDELPYELFDWFYLSEDGTGHELNERFIPMSGTRDVLEEYARNVTWLSEGNAIYLNG